MGIRHEHLPYVPTETKLYNIILSWLDQHEADLASDFRVEQEIWRQSFAHDLSLYIIKRIRREAGVDQEDGV